MGRISCRKRADKKGSIQQKKILIRITYTVTNGAFTSFNRSKCVVSKVLIDRRANIDNLTVPYHNIKHENPLKVEIEHRD